MGGCLHGAVTPPFYRTLRENPHRAHRTCEASWWAAATTADRGLCRCVRGRSAPVGRVMGVASTLYQPQSTNCEKRYWSVSLKSSVWPLLGGIRRLQESGAELRLWKVFTASPCTAPSKFAHMANQARATCFLGRKCSTDDGNAAGTASCGHLWCCGTKTFLGCARSTLMTMPMSHCRWRCPGCTNQHCPSGTVSRGWPLEL